VTSDEGEGEGQPIWGRTLQRRIVAGLVLLALGLLLVVGLRGPRSSPPTRLAGERTAGLRVACSGDGDRCSQKAQLRLFVSNGGRFRHVFAVGLDDRFGLHWYAPRPPDVVSAVAPAGADQPLGAPLSLAPDFAAGPLRIFALFSDAPLSAQELTSVTAELKVLARAPSTLQSLPLPRGDVLQKSALVELTP
jgi:hypothetical protein